MVDVDVRIEDSEWQQGFSLRGEVGPDRRWRLWQSQSAFHSCRERPAPSAHAHGSGAVCGRGPQAGAGGTVQESSDCRTKLRRPGQPASRSSPASERSRRQCQDTGRASCATPQGSYEPLVSELPFTFAASTFTDCRVRRSANSVERTFTGSAGSTSASCTTIRLWTSISETRATSGIRATRATGAIAAVCTVMCLTSCSDGSWHLRWRASPSAKWRMRADDFHSSHARTCRRAGR